MTNIDRLDDLLFKIGTGTGGGYAELIGVAADAVSEVRRETAPTIIRTVEELKALDPETVLGVWNPALDMGCIFLTAGELVREPADPHIRWAVIATAAQVRAARKALEEA